MPKNYSVTWTPPASDGGSPITGHDVGYTPAGGSETVEATGSTAASYTITGLTDGTEYSVRVRAENGVGKGPWSDAVTQIAALAPSQVTGLAVDSTGDGTIDLSWTAPASDSAITDYGVEYTLSGSSATTVNVGSATTSYQITGLTNYTEYSVRVAAVSAAGTGAYSTAVTGTPGAFSPSDIVGLQLWLDASDASTLYDATTGGSLVAAGGTVARWEDKSGNGLHVTGGSGPTLTAAAQNGKDVLVFNGSNSLVNTSNSFAQPNHYFIVAKTTDTASSSRNYLLDGYGANQGRNVISSRGSTSSTNKYGIWAGTWLNSTVSTSSTHVLVEALFNSGSSSVTVGGTGTSGNAGTEALGNFVIGNSVTLGGDPLTGEIAEIVSYSGVISGADLTAIRNYLTAKWSV